MSRPVSKFAEWPARAPVQDKFGLCGLLALPLTPIQPLAFEVATRSILETLLAGANGRHAPVAGYPVILARITLMIANIIAISLHAQTWADVQKRAGWSWIFYSHLARAKVRHSENLPSKM
ncbi:hypothetical protein N7475_000294 [Penicillium sp. IBT 31633x]|nr:hypothetical protein N7475_000294 [Penicillium sp. IBT 31633x]